MSSFDCRSSWSSWFSDALWQTPRFNRVRRPDVLPVRRREVAERQHRILVFHQAVHRLGITGLEALYAAAKGLVDPLLDLGHPDLVQGRLDFRLYRLRHLVQHIGRLVYPATLLSRLGPFLGTSESSIS